MFFFNEALWHQPKMQNAALSENSSSPTTNTMSNETKVIQLPQKHFSKYNYETMHQPTLLKAFSPNSDLFFFIHHFVCFVSKWWKTAAICTNGIFVVHFRWCIFKYKPNVPTQNNATYRIAYSQATMMLKS